MEPRTYNIVRRSNYNHEDWRGDEFYVAQKIPMQSQADTMCAALNGALNPYSEDWFTVVDSNYLLPPKWEP